MLAASADNRSLGYRGRQDWRDMSDYIVHFTKDVGEDVTAYTAMLAILADGHIEARRSFGCATNVGGLGSSQQCACFSEIPLDMLDRLVARRSRYGIGFHQATAVARGAGRVWYLDRETPHHAAFDQMVRAAMTGSVDADDEIWRVTPLVDYTAENYHFEWEREWRAPGGLRFAPSDVAFLFVPAELHEPARAFLSTGNGDNGPAYVCPLLDPNWSDDRIQAALRDLPTAPLA